MKHFKVYLKQLCGLFDPVIACTFENALQYITYLKLLYNVQGVPRNMSGAR